MASDIFNVEPPRWLTALATGVDQKLLGREIGEAASAGMTALQRDPNAPQDASWLSSRKGLFEGSREDSLNLQDPEWRLKQVQMEAQIASHAVQQETQFQLLQHQKQEFEDTHKDILQNRAWMAASPAQRAKMREQGTVPQWNSETGVKWGMDIDKADEGYDAKLRNDKLALVKANQANAWDDFTWNGSPEVQAAIKTAGGPWLVDPTNGERRINPDAAIAANKVVDPDGKHPELRFGATKEVVGAAAKLGVAAVAGAAKEASTKTTVEGRKAVETIRQKGAFDRTKYKSDEEYDRAIDTANIKGMVEEDKMDALNLREQRRDDTKLKLQENANNDKLVRDLYEAQLKHVEGKLKNQSAEAMKKMDGLLKNRGQALTQRDKKQVDSINKEIKDQERVLHSIADEADRTYFAKPPVSQASGQSGTRPWQGGGKQVKYDSAEAVRDAFKTKKISREEAADLLKDQFGFTQ